jgi:hypothetical protein
LSIEVIPREKPLGFEIAGFAGGTVEPRDAGLRVTRHAFPGEIEAAEPVLCGRGALLGGAAVPVV